jgi:hypothetical protein
LSIDEDYFIPVRGGDSGTKIEGIEGQSITGETADVEYIQKKLFAALKVPKAYLGYEEGLGSKATLSQQDIRFARTIARVQRTVLAELNKLAIIHLYCNGYTGEDLLDFNIQLSAPSTIAQIQKLELINSRFSTASTVQGLANLVDRRWIQKNVIRLTDEEIKAIEDGLKLDKIQDLELEATQLDAPETEQATSPNFGGDTDFGATPETPGDDEGTPEPPEDISELSISDEYAPIKVANKVKAIDKLLSEDEKSETDLKIKQSQFKTKEKNRKRQTKKIKGIDELDIAGSNKNKKKDDVTGMAREMSDLKSSYSFKSVSEADIRDEISIDEYLDNKIVQNAKITGNIKSAINSLEDYINLTPRVISENKSSEGEKK